MFKFKFKPVSSVREANLIAENMQLKDEISKLNLEKTNLETKIRKRELIDVRIGDPAPTDSESRKIYVSRIAEAHKNFLEPKLKQMISSAHSLLAESNNDREFDQSLKGGVYMLWEILRWGELMVNEQIANQTNQNPSLSEEEINNNKPQ